MTDPLLDLVNRYCRGELSADDYYAAVDVLAEQAIRDEIARITDNRIRTEEEKEK